MNSSMNIDNSIKIGGNDFTNMNYGSNNRSDNEYLHPMHNHPLYFTRNNTPWQCDGLRKKSGGCPKNNTVFSPRFRCENCDFDLCDLCLDMKSPTYGTLIKYHKHPHPLQCTAREDSSTMNCSECLYSYQTGNLRRVYRFRCDMCNYNLCEKCLLKENYHDISSGHLNSINPNYQPINPNYQPINPNYQPINPNYQSINPNYQPINPPIITSQVITSKVVDSSDDLKKDLKKDLKDDFKNQEELPEDKVCVICLENPKDATLVHAQTGIGHNVVCFGCANQLKNKGGVCPICRGHIDIVVKTFN